MSPKLGNSENSKQTLQTFGELKLLPTVGDVIWIPESSRLLAYLVCESPNQSNGTCQAFVLNEPYKIFEVKYRKAIQCKTEEYEKKRNFLKGMTTKKLRRTGVHKENISMASEVYAEPFEGRVNFLRIKRSKFIRKERKIPKRNASKRSQTNDEAEEFCKCSSSKNSKVCFGKCSNRKEGKEKLCTIRNCHGYERCVNRIPNSEDVNKKLEAKLIPGKGFGVFAKEKILKHEILIEYSGEIISTQEQIRRENMKKPTDPFYFMKLKAGWHIDPEETETLAKLINHSCSPNCEACQRRNNGTDVVVILAKKDIDPNTELTFDYKLPTNTRFYFPCLCGSENCRRHIGNKPKSD